MSLAFNLLDLTNQTHTHNLMALCGHLTHRVVVPFLRARGVYWDPRFEQFFLHHPASDPFAATGMMTFNPPPMFLGQLGDLEHAIQEELQNLGIRTAPFTPVYHADSLTIKTVVITILDNPTRHSGPPEVTMGTNAGGLVLRDLLGLDVQNGHYTFTADDLLRRLDAVTEPQILARSSAPCRSLGAPAPHRIPPTRSVVTTRRIHRCLGELRELAQWAQAHRCERIEAVPARKF
jgi:hypothetical protein